MDSIVRAKALKSAAKVAFAASVLAGCAADTDESVSAGESDLSLGKGCPSEDAGKTKGDSKADAGKGKDAAAFDCNAYVDEVVKQQTVLNTDDAGEWVTFPNWQALGQADKTLLTCCDKLIAAEDEQLADGGGWPAPNENHYTCCDVTGWSGGACTPWGPPVPPAMTTRRARRVGQLAEMAEMAEMAEVA